MSRPRVSRDRMPPGYLRREHRAAMAMAAGYRLGLAPCGKDHGRAVAWINLAAEMRRCLAGAREPAAEGPSALDPSKGLHHAEDPCRAGSSDQ